MDLALYEAARSGNINDLPFKDIGKGGMSDIFDQVSPLGNSLLHVAASSGNIVITELIVCHHSILVTKKNSQGDTPLHAAARFGRSSTGMALVNFASGMATTSNADDGLLRMKNDNGNTPLHNALMAIHFPICDTQIESSMQSSDFQAQAQALDLAYYLIIKDSQVCCRENKIGKSPLCMAVEFGDEEIVRYMMNALYQSDDSYEQKLEGKSPVHVALEERKLDMLKVIMELKPQFFHIRDEKKNTPLHIAVSLDYLEGVRYLLENVSNCALERNKKGLYPFHVACKYGRVQVMKELIRKWPDPSELLNHKGQNILHMAAKSGNLDILKFILSNTNMKRLLNEVDKDGNTPLHLAAFNFHSLFVYILLLKRANPSLVNYQGLLAADLVEKHFMLLDSEIYEKQNVHLKDQFIGMETPYDESSKVSKYNEKESGKLDSKKRSKLLNTFDVMMTLSTIHYMCNSCAARERELARACRVSQRIRSKLFQKEDIKHRINNLLVLATLIVGAAYAVSVQLPSAGGGTSDAGSSDSGIVIFGDIWTKVDLFHSFVTFDTLAMGFSILAALMLYCSQLVDISLAHTISTLSFCMLGLSLYFLSWAFTMAICLRLEGDTTFILGFGILQFIFVMASMGNLIIVLFLAVNRKIPSILVLYRRLCYLRILRYRMWTACLDIKAKLIPVISKLSRRGRAIG